MSTLLHRAIRILKQEGIRSFSDKGCNYVLTESFWVLKNLSAPLTVLLLKKRKIVNLNLFEQKIYSQNGEDGILKTIFYKISTTNRFCVEFGVQDGRECNTRYLIQKKGWDFLHMDCGDNLPSTIKKEFVNADNINSLFGKYNVPEQFDLLSIDIDYNDYWVWKAIQGYSPRVVVIEYNSSVPVNLSQVIKYDACAIWDGSNYFGASLLALKNLGETKGYSLLACDSNGVNAFFVRTDLLGNAFKIKNIEEIYRPPRYGKKKNGKYIGHPPGPKSMMNI